MEGSYILPGLAVILGNPGSIFRVPTKPYSIDKGEKNFQATTLIPQTNPEVNTLLSSRQQTLPAAPTRSLSRFRCLAFILLLK